MTPDQASAVVLAAIESSTVSADEGRWFQKLPPAGFTLFRRNLSPAFTMVRSFLESIHKFRPIGAPRLILAVDQEGGRVARLKDPFPDAGPALNLIEGKSDKEALLWLENYGFIVGQSLNMLGFNCNFAPVVDILSREDNPSIGDRCFGRTAEDVTKRAGAFMKGMQAASIIPCLKHFPGQGHGADDTHEGATRIEADQDLLLNRELLPYLALMQEVPMIMVSHAHYPKLDPIKPASLSSKIMQQFLRDKLHYQGLIVTDDMNMKAIAQDNKSWSEAVVASVAAGADLVLVCRDIERYCLAAEALSREAQASFAFHKRLYDALRRLHELRSRL